jgi:hypothetical protein
MYTTWVYFFGGRRNLNHEKRKTDDDLEKSIGDHGSLNHHKEGFQIAKHG